MKFHAIALLLLSLSSICYCKNATLVLVKDAVTKVRVYVTVPSLRRHSHLVLTYTPQGAVCLDGSPPGYYIRQGNGSSASKWILHLEGGGWCADEGTCLNRSKTALGSSTFWPPSAAFNGFLSDNATVNPDFYDWNMVYLMYCDGSSFTSNR